MEKNLNRPQTTPIPPSSPKASKGKAKFLIPLIILALLVGGYFALAKYQNLWPFENSGKEQEISGQANETADWKTYRNEEYGFEVRYPNSWSEVNGSFYSYLTPEAALEGESPYSLRIRVLEKATENQEAGPVECIKNLINYKVNNFPAQRYTDSCDYSEPTWFKVFLDNKIITGTNYSGDSDYVIIDQILSTFRFI